MKKEEVRHKMHKIFVSDYDGTITDKDFCSVLAERYAPADTPDYFAQYRERSDHPFRGNGDVLHVCANRGPQVEELLAALQADPDLGVSAALLQRAGWEVWVVS